MTYLDFALQAEEKGDFLPAIAYYEQSMVHQEGHLEAFLNVAFLYWVVAYDEGFQVHFLHTQGLDPEAVSSYASHWPRVLASAREQFPHEPEPLFWQRYFEEEATYAEHPDPFLLEQMLTQWPSFNLVYFYRYLHGYQGPAEREASRVLHRQLSGEKTKKSQWIVSRIESLWRFDFYL